MNEPARRRLAFRCLRLKNQKIIAAIMATPATAPTVPPATAAVFDFAAGTGLALAVAPLTFGATFPNAAAVAEFESPDVEVGA